MRKNVEKSTRRPILFASILSGVLLCCPPLTQPSRQKTLREPLSSSQLVVEAVTNKFSYNPSESLMLEVTVSNESDTPIFIFGTLSWGPSASLELFVANVDTGEQVSPNHWSDAHPRFPAETDFLKLNPSHFLGTQRTVSLDGLNISKPGHYRLEVAYHAPFSESYGHGLTIWGKERGTIYSKPIDIRVVAP